MRCPQCHSQNPEDAKFCMNCAVSLAQVCSECGTELPPQAKFCFNCATPVVVPSPAPEEKPGIPGLDKAIQRLVPKEFAERLLATRGQVAKERRLVTILFSDVKDSTAMARSLDPEEVMEIMDGAFDVLIEPVYRYEGTLARLMGDAILAFFGAPLAHEDDPERACRAALGIIEGARKYATRLERERGIRGFNVRVGINTGLVVVGEVGSDLRVEYTAMGDAVNVAARLESAAEPGTILVCEDTHKLIAHLFETEPTGPIQIKGRAEPVPAYSVLASKAAPLKLRGIAGLESPLVGREAECHALQEAIDRLQAGVGGIVTIVGEAGIGKSRLVAELRKVGANGRSPAQRTGPSTSLRTGLSPLQWAEGRCLSYGTSTAYLLWLDMLRGLLGLSVEGSPTALRDALREGVQGTSPEHFDDIYPYLGRLMSLPLEAEAEAAARDLEGEQLKTCTFRAVELLLECAASDRPLVLVCEDLHWADPTSIELLKQLLPLTDRASLLFICAFRPQTDCGSWDIRETVARLYRHRYTDLWLDPLSSAESETLVGNLLGVEGLPQQLKERVLGHAEGNPFYVEEIIRSLIGSEVLVRDEATGRWQVTREVADIAIPDSLQGVLTARIDRLQEGAKRVLQLAAVIGRVFPYRVLAVIAQEERKLDEHLLILQREQMIRERARLPELEYIFKHHLTHEAAYRGLLRRERRIFHRQVAETLEQLFSERIEEQVELLAYHWDRAEELQKAIHYLVRTGDRARRLGASLEAIDFYQSALQKVSELKAEGAAIEPYRIHERLGDVYLVNLSRHDESLEHYKAFLALAEAMEDLARGERKVASVYMLRGDLAKAQPHYETALARLSSLPPLAEASRVHCGLAYLLMSRNRMDEAEQHARASVEISGQISDTRGLADANRVMGVIASHRGNLEAACRYDERSLALYRELGDLPRIAQACNNVGDSHRLLGRMDRALECLSQGLELALRVGDTREEALLLLTMAELSIDQGEWKTAIAHLERALPLAEQAGVVARLIDAHRILGSAYEGTGQLEDARRHLEMAETLSWDTQHLRFVPGIYLNLARLSVTQSRCDEARGCIELALAAAGPEPSEPFLGIVHRCYGDLHRCRRDWDDAVMHLEDSWAFLERAEIPAEVGKTRLSLGIAYAERYAERHEEGDRGHACEQLIGALAIFRRMQARGYVTEVEVRLRELGCGCWRPDALLSEAAPSAAS